MIFPDPQDIWTSELLVHPRTSSNWFYPVSSKTWKQSLRATLVNTTHEWYLCTLNCYPMEPKDQTWPDPEHRIPFLSEGSIVQEDPVLKPLNPAQTLDGEDRFESCLLSPCYSTCKTKAFSFLKSWCHSLGFYVHLVRSLSSVTLGL